MECPLCHDPEGNRHELRRNSDDPGIRKARFEQANQDWRGRGKKLWKISGIICRRGANCVRF